MGAALATLGLFCALVAVSGLRESFGAFVARAPLVRVRTGAAAAVPTALTLLMLAAMLIRRPSADGRRERRLFGVVLACLLLLTILPFALNLGMGAALRNRDYRRCEGPMGSRQFLTRVWVRGDTPCPAP